MYREIDPEEAEGKRLLKFVLSYDRAIVVFDDETFFYLEATCEYECPELEVATFDISKFPGRELVDSGVCSKEEVDASEAKRQRELDERNTRWRRQQYENLKREFGES